MLVPFFLGNDDFSIGAVLVHFCSKIISVGEEVGKLLCTMTRHHQSSEECTAADPLPHASRTVNQLVQNVQFVKITRSLRMLRMVSLQVRAMNHGSTQHYQSLTTRVPTLMELFNMILQALPKLQS